MILQNRHWWYSQIRRKQKGLTENFGLWKFDIKIYVSMGPFFLKALLLSTNTYLWKVAFCWVETKNKTKQTKNMVCRMWLPVLQVLNGPQTLKSAVHHDGHPSAQRLTLFHTDSTDRKQPLQFQSNQINIHEEKLVYLSFSLQWAMFYSSMVSILSYRDLFKIIFNKNNFCFWCQDDLKTSPRLLLRSAKMETEIEKTF